MWSCPLRRFENNYQQLKQKNMLSEVNEAKDFLAKKFNGVENVKPGIYAIPTETSKGPAFMKVEIMPDMGMRDFHLFKDEALTESWYEDRLQTK